MFPFFLIGTKCKMNALFIKEPSVQVLLKVNITIYFLIICNQQRPRVGECVWQAQKSTSYVCFDITQEIITSSLYKHRSKSDTKK